ncbi:hypothetical protein OEZ74_27145, partial [Leclercia adecarboxylata]|uniref:hypothetical protein n=1 Tax=Leclercia adecarboxylata TaxID=83655 RepID=UPI00234C66B2
GLLHTLSEHGFGRIPGSACIGGFLTAQQRCQQLDILGVQLLKQRRVDGVACQLQGSAGLGLLQCAGQCCVVNGRGQQPNPTL